MGWTLAPGTGFCETAGELVFLDLARDKYLALRGQDRAAFDRLRAGEPNDSDAMTRLQRTGLLQSTDKPTSIEPTVLDVPSQDLSALAEEGFRLDMAVSSLMALRWARAAMRPERIGRTIEDRRRRATSIQQGAASPLIEIHAARYAANRWINPVPQRCLVDALALDRILLAKGLVPTLVFGIRMAPFKAHCWLQTPSTILTGTAAEARNFTPILVVR